MGWKWGDSIPQSVVWGQGAEHLGEQDHTGKLAVTVVCDTPADRERLVELLEEHAPSG